jgi:sugar/nucleoside kinase (ribokinase family)
MMAAQFAVLGNICIDDLVFEDGSTLWGIPGGNAIYAGLGMAIWGERPQIVAPVGPEYPIHRLAGRVDLSRCRPLPRTLRDWGLYEEDGTRTFVFRASTRNWHEFSPVLEDVDRLEPGYVHIAPMPTELQVKFARALRDRGAKAISVDIDNRELGPIAEANGIDWPAFLAVIDLFLPSRQDVETLLPGLSMPDALRALRELAPSLPVIAIKLGARGVLVHAAGAEDFIAVPTIADTVVDATGAGDTFSGGAIYGFARAESALDAALSGSVSASFAVASPGTTALVEGTREEACRRLERLKSRIETHRL